MNQTVLTVRDIGAAEPDALSDAGTFALRGAARARRTGGGELN